MYLIGNQEQVDLVVIGFEDHAKICGIKLVRTMIKGHPRLLGETLKLLCLLDFVFLTIGRNCFSSSKGFTKVECV